MNDLNVFDYVVLAWGYVIALVVFTVLFVTFPIWMIPYLIYNIFKKE